MPSKQDDLKQRLAAVLRDLKEEGPGDPEAVWMIGSLTALITDKAGAPSWSVYKKSITRREYDGLLADFQRQGNGFYQAGEVKRAYAIQALALSLVCRTQKDPEIRQGEALLDQLIQGAVAIFRRSQQQQNRAN